MELRKPSKKRSIFISNCEENTLLVKVKKTTETISNDNKNKFYKQKLQINKSDSIPELVEKSFRTSEYEFSNKSKKMKLKAKGNYNVSNKETENLDSSLNVSKPPIQTKITLSSKVVKVSQTSENDSPNHSMANQIIVNNENDLKYNLQGKDNVNINLSMNYKGVPSHLTATLNPSKEMECNIRYNTDNDPISIKELQENLNILNKTIGEYNKQESHEKTVNDPLKSSSIEKKVDNKIKSQIIEDLKPAIPIKLESNAKIENIEPIPISIEDLKQVFPKVENFEKSKSETSDIKSLKETLPTEIENKIKGENIEVLSINIEDVKSNTNEIDDSRSDLSNKLDNEIKVGIIESLPINIEDSKTKTSDCKDLKPAISIELDNKINLETLENIPITAKDSKSKITDFNKDLKPTSLSTEHKTNIEVENISLSQVNAENSKFQSPVINENTKPTLSSNEMKDEMKNVNKLGKIQNGIEPLTTQDSKYQTIDVKNTIKTTKISDNYAIESNITKVKLKEYENESSISNISSPSKFVADSSELSMEVVPAKQNIDYTLIASVNTPDSSLDSHLENRFSTQEPSFIYQSSHSIKTANSIDEKITGNNTFGVESIIISPPSPINQVELIKIVPGSESQYESKSSTERFSSVTATKTSSESYPVTRSESSKQTKSLPELVPFVSSSFQRYTMSSDSTSHDLGKFLHLKQLSKHESESVNDKNSFKIRLPPSDNKQVVIEIDKNKTESLYKNDYIIESNVTSLNIKEYRDYCDDSDNSLQFKSTVSNSEKNSIENYHYNKINKNIYQTYSPVHEYLLKQKNKDNIKKPEKSLSEKSKEYELKSISPIQGKKQSALEKYEKKNMINGKLITVDNSALIKENLQSRTHKPEESQNRYIISVKNITHNKIAKPSTKYEFNKDHTSSSVSYETADPLSSVLDKQYLLHEKIPDEKSVGYVIKQTEISVMIEEPFSLSTAVSYKETELTRDIKSYLSDDFERKPISGKTIDSQYLKHSKLNQNTYQSTNSERFQNQSLSKLSRPVEKHCQFMISEQDIKNIIANLEKLTEYPRNTFKDVPGILNEINVSNETLKQLALNINLLNYDGVSIDDLKDLENYIEQMSSKYKEWKQKNNPSDSAKEKFLLNLVEVIQKTRISPCSQKGNDCTLDDIYLDGTDFKSLDTQYLTHSKLSENVYQSEENDNLGDTGLREVSKSKDNAQSACPFIENIASQTKTDKTPVDLNSEMRKVNLKSKEILPSTNHVSVTNPPTSYKSKLYNRNEKSNVETEKNHTSNKKDNKKALTNQNVSIDISEMKNKIITEENNTRSSSRKNYASFFMELFKTLQSTDLEITESLLNELDSNLKLLIKNGLKALTQMELERLAKYVHIINDEWKDSKKSITFTDKQFCESLLSHVKESKCEIRKNKSTSSPSKTKNLNKIDKPNETVQKGKYKNLTDSTNTTKKPTEITDKLKNISDKNTTENFDSTEPIDNRSFPLNLENLLSQSKNLDNISYRQFFIELSKLIEFSTTLPSINHMKQTLIDLESLKNNSLSQFSDEQLKDIAKFINILKENWKNLNHPSLMFNEKFLEAFSSQIQLLLTESVSKSNIPSTSDQQDPCNKRYMKTPFEISKRNQSTDKLENIESELTNTDRGPMKKHKLNNKDNTTDIDNEKGSDKNGPFVSIEASDLYTATNTAPIEINGPPVLDNQTFSLEIENIITKARQSNTLNYAKFFIDLINILNPSIINVNKELLNQLEIDIDKVKLNGIQSLYNKELERLAEFINSYKDELKDLQNPHLYENDKFIEDLLKLIKRLNKPVEKVELTRALSVDDILEASQRKSLTNIPKIVLEEKLPNEKMDENLIAEPSSGKNDIVSQNQAIPQLKESSKIDENVNYNDFFTKLYKRLSPLRFDITDDLLDQLLLDIDIMKKESINSLPTSELEKLAEYIEISKVDLKGQKITESLTNEEFIRQLTFDIRERKSRLKLSLTKASRVSNPVPTEIEEVPVEIIKLDSDINYPVYFLGLSKILRSSKLKLTKDNLNQLLLDINLLKNNGISSLSTRVLERIAHFVDKSKPNLKDLSNPLEYKNEKFLDDLIFEANRLLGGFDGKIEKDKHDSNFDHSKDSGGKDRLKNSSKTEEQKSNPNTLSPSGTNNLKLSSNQKSSEKESSKNKSKTENSNVENLENETNFKNIPSLDLMKINPNTTNDTKLITQPHILFPLKTNTTTMSDTQVINNDILPLNSEIILSKQIESPILLPDDKSTINYNDETIDLRTTNENQILKPNEINKNSEINSSMITENNAVQQSYLSISSIKKMKPLVLPEKSNIVTTDIYTKDSNNETLLVQLSEKLTSFKNSSDLITEMEITDKLLKHVVHSVEILDNNGVFLPITNVVEVISEYTSVPNETIKENLPSQINEDNNESYNKIEIQNIIIPEKLLSKEQKSETNEIISEIYKPNSFIELIDQQNINIESFDDGNKESIQITIVTSKQSLIVDDNSKFLPNEVNLQQNEIEDSFVENNPKISQNDHDSNIEVSNDQNTKEVDNPSKDDIIEKTKESDNLLENDFDDKSQINEILNEENYLDNFHNDIVNHLIEKSLDSIFAKKSAGDDFSKCNPSFSDSCDNDLSENTECLPQSPIINYKINTCFSSKAPIKIAHHEEHSHLQIHKCANNKNELKLSNTAFRRTEIIFPKSKRKISNGMRTACDKIIEKEPLFLYNQIINDCVKNSKVKTNKNKPEVQIPKPVPPAIPSPVTSIISASDYEKSDYEMMIPTIVPKNEKPDSIVKFNADGKWPNLSKRKCEGIQIPYGYYKKNNEYFPYSSLFLNQTKPTSYYSNKDEFQIPSDGIFGRDPQEPQFTNFCCNICKSWINLGDRQQHQKECINLKRSSDSIRPKLQPRTIKRMPGIVCYVCGNRFTKHSISIHEKACLSKWIQLNSSLKRQLRKQIPIKPTLNEAEIQHLIKDQHELGKFDYCAEDAINDLYFLSSRNHIIDFIE